MHLLQLPAEYAHPCFWWGCSRLNSRLKESPYYEPDIDKADFVFLAHKLPFDSTDQAPEMWAYIAQHYPYFNRSARPGRPARSLPALAQPGCETPARAPHSALITPACVHVHQVEKRQVRTFLHLNCDHGPGDCEYTRMPIERDDSSRPAAWNPAHPDRVVGHLQWNGARA